MVYMCKNTCVKIATTVLFGILVYILVAALKNGVTIIYISNNSTSAFTTPQTPFLNVVGQLVMSGTLAIIAAIAVAYVWGNQTRVYRDPESMPSRSDNIEIDRLYHEKENLALDGTSYNRYVAHDF